MAKIEICFFGFGSLGAATVATALLVVNGHRTLPTASMLYAGACLLLFHLTMRITSDQKNQSSEALASVDSRWSTGLLDSHRLIPSKNGGSRFPCGDKWSATSMSAFKSWPIHGTTNVVVPCSFSFTFKTGKILPLAVRIQTIGFRLQRPS